jgi:hypothetical protein
MALALPCSARHTAQLKLGKQTLLRLARGLRFAAQAQRKVNKQLTLSILMNICLYSSFNSTY